MKRTIKNNQNEVLELQRKIGEAVRFAAFQSKKTIKQILSESGVSDHAYYAIIKGKTTHTESLFSLCLYFGIKIFDL